MESRKVFVLGAVMVAATGGLLALGYNFLQEREPTLAQLLPQSQEIVVVRFDKDLEVRGGDEFTATVKSSLRGDSQGGSDLKIVSPGGASQRLKFAKDQDYVFLLAPLRDDVWQLVSPAQFPLSDRGVRYVAKGTVLEEQKPEAFQSLIEKHPHISQATRRTSLAGKWYLVVSGSGSDFAIAVIELAQNDNTWEGNLLTANVDMEAALIKSVAVKGDVIDIVLGGIDSHFRGRLINGVVKGEMRQADVGVAPARLIATEARTLKGREAPGTTQGSHGFNKALEDETIEAMEDWLKAHPESPLVIEAFKQILDLATREKPKAEEVDKLSARMLATAGDWGPQLKTYAKFTLGSLLLERNFQLEKALEYFEQVGRESGPAGWKAGAKKGTAFVLFKLGKEAEGAALLEELRKTAPYDVRMTFQLAQFHQKQKQIDQALPLYAQLAVLPLAEMEASELLREGGPSSTGRSSPRRSSRNCGNRSMAPRRG